MDIKETDGATGVIGLKSVDSYGVYEQGFGFLNHKTVYADGLNTHGMFNIDEKSKRLVDLRDELNKIAQKGMNTQQSILIKALTSQSGGAGTAGRALVPIFVDPRIIDLSRKYTPFVEIIPRMTNLGMTADFNEITAKGAAVTAAEDAALTEADDTENRQSKAIKFIYSVGRVTGPAQAAIPSYILQGFQATGSGLSGSVFTSVGAPNARQYEVVKKARSLREKEEDLIWNGNSSSDSTEFDGIVQQQSTTNQTDKSSTALEYDDIENSVNDAFVDGGRPNIAGSSSTVLTDLRKIMIDTFNYRPQDMTATLPFGVSSHLVLETMVGPVPVIPSTNLSNTTGAKQIFFLDMSAIEMRVLLDMTFQELAQTNDSQKFMLKIYETLVLRAPSFNSFIDNIS